jgi:cell division protein FtsL
MNIGKFEINKSMITVAACVMIIVFQLVSSSNVYYQQNALQGKISNNEYQISQLTEESNTYQNQLADVSSNLAKANEQIKTLNASLEQKNNDLQQSYADLQDTQADLSGTQAELTETNRLLDVARYYENRVNKGINPSLAYQLLGDYDKTVQIVSNFTDVYPPRNDIEIWDRAKAIYTWIGQNYKYCSDRGFCISEVYCPQIQFFSPDELVYFGAHEAMCGDCDDHAQLFVGMMYASGVPHDKARVECGNVAAGAHCWAGVNINNGWYRVDTICANPVEYINFLGLKIAISPKTFPTTAGDVGCFPTYSLTSWYDLDGYHQV